MPNSVLLSFAAGYWDEFHLRQSIDLYVYHLYSFLNRNWGKYPIISPFGKHIHKTKF